MTVEVVIEGAGGLYMHVQILPSRKHYALDQVANMARHIANISKIYLVDRTTDIQWRWRATRVGGDPMRELRKAAKIREMTDEKYIAYLLEMEAMWL